MKEKKKREAVNRMKLVFDARSENESFARYALTAFAAQLDPDMEELADIRTSVSEAVTNCIIHGYRGTYGRIMLEAVLYSDRSMKITVTDKGCGIEDVPQAMQPLFTTDRSGERGGMGFAIMQSFNDQLQVISHPGKGTRVIMKRKLK